MLTTTGVIFDSVAQMLDFLAILSVGLFDLTGLVRICAVIGDDLRGLGTRFGGISHEFRARAYGVLVVKCGKIGTCVAVSVPSLLMSCVVSAIGLVDSPWIQSRDRSSSCCQGVKTGGRTDP